MPRSRKTTSASPCCRSLPASTKQSPRFRRNTRPPVVAGSVKTTRKSARARVGDTKPAPKPLVVAAQPEAARWALDTDDPISPTPPAVRRSSICSSVPSEVYATGFQRNTVVADAGRFTGKAITFMPVARFQTN